MRVRIRERSLFSLLLSLLVAAVTLPSSAASATPLVGMSMPGGHASSAASPAVAAVSSPSFPPEHPWRWPVDGRREVTEPFRAPAHDYAAGHRGIDIAASIGTIVYAPADGVVAFRGVVVDRPLLTIDHGGEIVTTFEPLESTLMPGEMVSEGQEIGIVSTGGHAIHGTMHVGVRLNGIYMNPMLLFGDVPRAILLPCCAAL